MHMMAKTNRPTPAEIVAIAEKCGFYERREQVSSTIFLAKNTPEKSFSINVYYTTGGLMTDLDHPVRGQQCMWRSSAYDDIAGLESLLVNPRLHTPCGYRHSTDASYGCTVCGDRKKKPEFSAKQWTMRSKDVQKCKQCVDQYLKSKKVASCSAARKKGIDQLAKNVIVSNTESETEIIDTTVINGIKACSSCENQKAYADFPLLDDHSVGDKCQECIDDYEILQLVDEFDMKLGGVNLTSKSLSKHNKEDSNFQRRQFCCPHHSPRSFIFFKQVPIIKPVAKCPQCKKQHGKQQPRLLPIPSESEKGYGLFRCLSGKCCSSWGSSRACRSLGQFCLDPKGLGVWSNFFFFSRCIMMPSLLQILDLLPF
jgi:hypothetical protein